MKPELLNSLKTYKKADIWRDLLAGLMVAFVALPLSIALGKESISKDVSPYGIQMGLVTAIIAGFFISALGGSRLQIGGPTAAFVVIIFNYALSPDIGILGLAIAGCMAGLLLIVLGLCRVGSLMKFFPYPIIVGFTTGIGVTLLIGQIKDFCGLKVKLSGEVIERLATYATGITTFHYPTFIVGVVGLISVLLIPKLNKKIPAALIALIVCTALCSILNAFCNTNIATIGSEYGDIKAGFYLPDFSKIAAVDFGKLIIPTFVIAFLCAIESLLSASVAAGMTKTNLDSNQELIGQGVANIFSSLLGGLPATGAIARTVTNIENGGKSPLAGMFHAIFILIMYFALMGVVQFIPLAAFAAILIRVAINMSRFGLFFKLVKFGWRDVIILLISFALTVVFDLTYGVVCGIAIAILINIPNMRVKLVVSDVRQDGALDVSGTLYFLNVNRLIDRLEKALVEHDKITVDMAKVTHIDQSALEKLLRLIRNANAVEKSIEPINCNERIGSRLDKYLSVL